MKSLVMLKIWDATGGQELVMKAVTRLLEAADHGDPDAAEVLPPVAV